MEEILQYFGSKFSLLDDAEIIKVLISQSFYKDIAEEVEVLSDEDQKSLEKALRSPVGFSGNAQDAIKWLKE